MAGDGSVEGGLRVRHISHEVETMHEGNLSGVPNNVGADRGWTDAWPDAVAFAGGLGLAWHFQWETRDLVWSLWLSSLVVGYAMIVWSIFGPGAFIATKAWADRDLLRNEPKWPMAAGGAALLVGGLPAAAIAERQAFRFTPGDPGPPERRTDPDFRAHLTPRPSGTPAGRCAVQRGDRDAPRQ